MTKQLIRCCEETQDLDLIYLEDDANLFHLVESGDVIYYCPWCGIQLVKGKV